LILITLATWIVGRVFLIMLHFKLLSPIKIPLSQSIGILLLVIFVSSLYIIDSVLKHGRDKLKYRLLILFGMMALFFYFDIGNKYVQEWKSNRDMQKAIELQTSTDSYYKHQLAQPYIFKEYIWYSPTETYYVFEKNGEVSTEDIMYLLNILKPLDRLEISIQLISQTKPYQVVMSFSNKKVLIGCTKPPFNNSDKINICK